MTTTITKTYASTETLDNVKDDLIATGIEAELIYIDKTNKQVKVIIPATAAPEINEILGRHQPLD